MFRTPSGVHALAVEVSNGRRPIRHAAKKEYGGGAAGTHGRFGKETAPCSVMRFDMLAAVARPTSEVFMPDAMTDAARILRALASAFIIAFAGVAAAGPAASAAERKVVALSLVKGVVRDVPGNTVRVKEGDDVELRWSSDRPATLHLHGYEVEAKVAPGKTASMAFRAKFPGRFPVHEHAEGDANHRPVLYLEVYP